MTRKSFLYSFVVSVCLAAGCAFDVYHLPQEPCPMQAQADPAKGFTLARDFTVTPPGGFDRTLRGGTAWSLVGVSAKGEVFKSAGQTLTVEASHVHEAYLVVNNGSLAGFYLPVEKSFVPLSAPINLPISK